MALLRGGTTDPGTVLWAEFTFTCTSCTCGGAMSTATLPDGIHHVLTAPRGQRFTRPATPEPTKHACSTKWPTTPECATAGACAYHLFGFLS